MSAICAQFEELLDLGKGWRVTHLCELSFEHCSWQAIATDEVHVVTATGGSIGEAISNVLIKTETGPFDKVKISVPYDEPKRSLASIIPALAPPVQRINRRI